MNVTWLWEVRNSKESRLTMNTYGQLVFDKGVKNVQWEKKNTVSSAGHVGKVGQTHVNQ